MIKYTCSHFPQDIVTDGTFTLVVDKDAYSISWVPELIEPEQLSVNQTRDFDRYQRRLVGMHTFIRLFCTPFPPAIWWTSAWPISLSRFGGTLLPLPTSRDCGCLASRRWKRCTILYSKKKKPIARRYKLEPPFVWRSWSSIVCRMH